MDGRKCSLLTGRLTAREYERTFWGAGNILYCHLNSGDTGGRMYKISSLYIHKVCVRYWMKIPWQKLVMLKKKEISKIFFRKNKVREKLPYKIQGLIIKLY